MRRFIATGLFAALLFGLTGVGRPALAADHDGNWTVLIITEKGDCDQAYRYPVGIANGQVRYTGDASVKMSGTVSPAGAVKVSLRLGDKGADGTGNLSGSTGAGRWQGAGGGTSCSGRWEAERR
jgi:hypothetical protein